MFQVAFSLLLLQTSCFAKGNVLENVSGDNVVQPWGGDKHRRADRRLTSVASWSEFSSAMVDYATIEVTANLFKTSSSSALSVVDLVVDGNNFVLDGGGGSSSSTRRCFYFSGSTTEVTIYDLVMENCRSASNTAGAAFQVHSQATVNLVRVTVTSTNTATTVSCTFVFGHFFAFQQLLTFLPSFLKRILERCWILIPRWDRLDCELDWLRCCCRHAYCR
jgi:hypothetical protein